jgi:hypothetical protein
MKYLFLFISLGLFSCTETKQELEERITKFSLIPPQAKVLVVYTDSRDNIWVKFKLEGDCFLFGSYGSSSRVLSPVKCPEGS